MPRSPVSADGGLLPAAERLPVWQREWSKARRLVLLLDFDGTLAPIVARPELAAMPPQTRTALERLITRPDVALAVVSGRGLADVRGCVGIQGLIYAGNHGMEIEGPGVCRVHQEAVAARPALENASRETVQVLDAFPGAWLEDKGLTLSVHYRQLDEDRIDSLAAAISHIATSGGLRLTHGKKVLEIRPRVEWNKGKAVLFLLEQLAPPAGAPVLYFGDDTTDEDAFRVLRAWRGGTGEGVLVADLPSPGSAAHSFVRTPSDVGVVLAKLAEQAE